MADSMDGRMLDSYSNKALMPAFDELKASGVNFVRHYCNSPQCVPSRTSMITSRYVHETGTSNNGQGIARSPTTGLLDSNCVKRWNQSQCDLFAARQNVTATLIDLIGAANYELILFGRFDLGAGILDEYNGTTGDGFHGGPSLDILARGAGIEGSQKAEPWSTTVENDTSPHASDVNKMDEVLEYMSTHDPSEYGRPWFFWFGIADPHPPYDSNSTYLARVNQSAVDVPPSVPLSEMHLRPVVQRGEDHRGRLHSVPAQDNAQHILGHVCRGVRYNGDCALNCPR
jgi:arylsulfatase A-like enzyme